MGFFVQWRSNVDGDRFLIIDERDYDMTGWSIIVRDGIRAFGRNDGWYSYGGRFYHDGYGNAELRYPWTALCDHGEVVRFCRLMKAAKDEMSLFKRTPHAGEGVTAVSQVLRPNVGNWVYFCIRIRAGGRHLHTPIIPGKQRESTSQAEYAGSIPIIGSTDSGVQLRLQRAEDLVHGVDLSADR